MSNAGCLQEVNGVLAVDTPWTVRSDVEAKAILRDRGVAFEVLCVHHRAEIDGRRPRPKRAEPFIVIVALCKHRSWAQGGGESKRSDTLKQSSTRRSSECARSTDQILSAMRIHAILLLVRYLVLQLFDGRRYRVEMAAACGQP